MTFQINRRAFLAGTGSLVALHPFAVRAQEGQAHLRLMETTDLHVHVLPYNYYANAPMKTAGLARTATLIEQVRAESANSLLLDNGDFLQGNPMGDYIAYERGMPEGSVHPVVEAMNVLGFDAPRWATTSSTTGSTSSPQRWRGPGSRSSAPTS